MKQRGFTPVIILLVVILFGSLGYLVYSKGLINVITTKLFPPSNQVVVSSPLPTTNGEDLPKDTTVSWEVYTVNYPLKFTFKYPNKLRALPHAEQAMREYLIPVTYSDNLSFSDLLGIDGAPHNFFTNSDIWIVYTHASSYGANTPKDILKQYEYNAINTDIYFGEIETSEIMVDGNNSLFVHFNPIKSDGVPAYRVDIPTNNLIISLTMKSLDKNTLEANKELFDQIVSTVKFTQY